MEKRDVLRSESKGARVANRNTMSSVSTHFPVVDLHPGGSNIFHEKRPKIFEKTSKANMAEKLFRLLLPVRTDGTDSLIWTKKYVLFLPIT